MNNMLYNDTYCIGIEELNNIYTSLLTCADHIYLNNGIEVDWQLPKPLYDHICNSIRVLHEKKLIIYWDFPYKKGRTDADVTIDQKNFVLG